VRTSILSQYQRIPTEGRLGLGDQLAAWKTDPTTAPVLVRPWLGTVAAPVVNGAPAPKVAAPAVAARPAPDVNGGVQPRTDGGGAFQSGAAVRAVGDGSYRANRDALYAAAGLGKPPPMPGG